MQNPLSLNPGVSPYRMPSVVPSAHEVFLTASEAGDFLKLHPATVQRLARQGMIPAHPLAGRKRRHWRFLRSELSDWLRGRNLGEENSL
jgi:excisionase family DNA binding protein